MVAVALVAIGCGGSGDAEPATLSKAEVIAQGDRICVTYRSRTADQTRPDTRAEIAVQARETREAFTELLASFRALEPPEEDRDVLRRYLASIDRFTTRVLPELEQAAAAGREAQAAASLRELARLGEEQRQLAGRYGFKVCGTPQDPNANPA